MDVLRQVGGVLLVFALLGVALWVLRRGGNASFRGIWIRQGPRKPKSLEPLERLALTPQHSLHLVRLHGRELVVVTHPQGCALITDATAGEISRRNPAEGTRSQVSSC